MRRVSAHLKSLPQTPAMRPLHMGCETLYGLQTIDIQGFVIRAVATRARVGIVRWNIPGLIWVPPSCV